MQLTSMHRTRGGYTLIELTVVIAILSFVIAGGLGVYSKRSDSIKIETTETHLRMIDARLQQYFARNRFLPCPAPGNVADTDDTFGVSVAYDAANANACDFPQVGVQPTNTRGVVPVRTLNLPDTVAYDGWGRKFSYDVASGMGSVADALNDQNSGDIMVSDALGPLLTDPDHGAAYIILSHGNNGTYAWLRNGTLLGDGGTPPGVQLNNSTGDDRSYTYGFASAEFDDVVIFRTKGEVMTPYRVVRPVELQSFVAQNARTVLDVGLGATYIAAHTGTANATVSASIALDRLYNNATNRTPRNCIKNLLWLDTTSAGIDYRPAPDCYCPGEINPPTSLEKFLSTGFANENFGGCF